MDHHLHYYETHDIKRHFAKETWQKKCYSEFESTLRSHARPFPCLRGVMGLQKGNLRFSFHEKITAESLAPTLTEYCNASRDYGDFTSLVAFEKPSELQSIAQYHDRFWKLLDALAASDTTAWPTAIPNHTNNAKWEFCFAGEPLFVVCNTPAHIMRRSRYFPSFMLTFQPRWIFEKLLDTSFRAVKEFDVVSQRLSQYDHVEKAAVLGRYGDRSNKEALQYFLSDGDNVMHCPFSHLGEKHDV